MRRRPRHRQRQAEGEISLSLRYMDKPDMGHVLDIERRSFVDPWTKGDFAEVFTNASLTGQVLERIGGASVQLIGYVVYEIFPKRLNVVSFAIHPRWRRQKVGAWMLDRVKGLAHGAGKPVLTAVVCEENLPGQLFLKAAGFTAFEIVEGFYRFRWLA